jgi:2-polyprenyl-3-methyl-5-hydroxy-6-metoxy-1,4-benzoquinol methylase
MISGEDRTELVDCLCGGARYVQFSDTDRHGIPSPVAVCCNCGLGFVSRRPDEQALRRFYNEDYFDLYASVSARDEATLFAIQGSQGQAVLDFVLGCGVPLPNRVFDIGCGTGGMLEVFLRRGASIHGADYAENLVVYGNSRLGEGVLKVGGVEVLRGEGLADLVVASHLIEHVPDPVAWAFQLREIVSPGGHVYILTPGLRSRATLFDGLEEQLLNMHLYYFTLRTLNMIMSRAGFILVSDNETIEAVYRRADNCPTDPALGPGDPSLVRWLRGTGMLHPLIRAMYPAYRLVSDIKNRILR